MMLNQEYLIILFLKFDHITIPVERRENISEAKTKKYIFADILYFHFKLLIENE